MKIKLAMWSVKTAHQAQCKIDPRPQFQRGEVWTLPRKQLLIDSVLRGFDVPKIYLSQTVSNPHHRFEVADGQQRLRAFWSFFEDGYPLGSQSVDVSGTDLSGRYYSTLPQKFRTTLDKYKLTIAILIGASQEQLRTLFARLQMGVVLTPAELRNAIASAVGSMINTLAETHGFFLTSAISPTRFKHQDLLAHALALSHYDNEEDLKAKLLREFYEEFPTTYPAPMARKASETLDRLEEINLSADLRIRTKWGFVDLFWFFWQQLDDIKSIDVPAFGRAYVDFENKRQINNQEPESLLGTPDEPLYEYIQAFNTSGADVDNIDIRNAVMKKYFRKYVRRKSQ